MKLFLYYAFHSVKNQIKKLFKTWVALFLLACFAFGLLFGVGAALLFDDEEESYAEEEVVAEEIPFTEADALAVVELAVAGISLSMLTWQVISAEKSGGQIFLPADVNLLFAAPMKPQSVLLFRLAGQLGTILLASLYLSFQIPNMVLSAGLGVPAAVAIILVWYLLLVYAKLLNILIYTVTSTHERIRRYIRPVTYGILGVTLLAFLLFSRQSGLSWYHAAIAFFNAPWTRVLPVYGWMKGLALYSITGEWLLAALCLAALLIGAVVLVWIIWRIKADFYEDAMAHSAETAQLQEAAASEGPVIVKRKKERSERVKREGFTRGEGASMYFHKAMYNRFRFAHGRVFTKTSETYLVTAFGTCALVWYFGSPSLIPVGLILTAFCFFRALGNPLSADIDQAHFRMVPESAHKKVFYSLLGGSVNCLLDLIPAFAVATVWMHANPLEALVWMVFAVAVDLYASTVALFLQVSIPTGVDKMIRQLLMILFIYFGLIPIAALLVIGYVIAQPLLFFALAILLAVAVSALFFALAPLFIQNGQR